MMPEDSISRTASNIKNLFALGELADILIHPEVVDEVICHEKRVYSLARIPISSLQVVQNAVCFSPNLLRYWLVEMVNGDAVFIHALGS